MPIAMDKDVKFSYVLETDKAKPAETRPTFYFSALTMRNWQKMNQRARDIKQIKSVDEALNELCSMIADHLVGWDNMMLGGKVVRFNKKRLADLITMQEGWELIQGIKDQGMTDDDQKN